MNVGITITWIGIVINIFVMIAALLIVPRNRKPSSGTAWLMLIFFLPYIGVIIYLIIGSPKLPKARRNVQQAMDTSIKHVFSILRQSPEGQALLSQQIPDKYKGASRLAETLTSLPLIGGNQVKILPEYDEVFTSIVHDINHARHSVYLEYFIISLDPSTEPIFAAMAAAVQRGVTVRVLYDSYSSKQRPNFKKMLRRFEAEGVIVQAMLPFRLPGFGYVRPDLRNHRKLVIIDGTIAYTGSQNLIQRNYYRKDAIYYDEVVARVHGPVALELAAVFLTDWRAETGKLINTAEMGLKDIAHVESGTMMVQALPSGPGYDDENNLKLFTDLIHRAKNTITIVNPYFVPDESVLNAITSATKRGVKVILVNSEAIDQLFVAHAQRSFYEGLLRAGVDIYLYDAPVLLHSKFMLIDEDVATIGSSNFDIRSFTLNLEVTLIIYDHRVVNDLQKLAAQYLKRSKKIKPATWYRRSGRKVLFDNLARLTSALQ